MVEGNTDVIALRQAGFEPVVASMGTALTEAHLRELGRLSKRLFLCFDADAAGQDATLRGMELAVGQGFDVRVVALPKGQDPADAPDGFEERLAAADSYVVYRVKLELERASERQEAGFANARTILAAAEGLPRSAEGDSDPEHARPAQGDSVRDLARQGPGVRTPAERRPAPAPPRCG